MLFKDVKTGYPIFILHKTDPLILSQGKVISNPTTHVSQIQPFNPMNTQTTQMMVDVTIEDGGVTKTYTIPETSSVTYGNDLVLSTDREGLIREVESMKAVSQDHLNQVSFHEKRLASCEKILSDLNPAFKEKKDTEARFGKIENDMKDVKTMITDLIKKLS